MNEDRNGASSGKISRRVAWWVGVLAGLAGITALVLTNINRDEFTINEWSREASAACDDLYGEVQENYRVANELLDKVQPDGPGDENDQVAAAAWTRLGGAERKVTGEMGRIQTPTSHNETVQDLLEAMNDVSDEDYGLADDLRRLRFDSQSYESFAKQRNAFVAQAIDYLNALKVTHCLAGQ